MEQGIEMADIIDGRQVSAKIKDRIKTETLRLNRESVRLALATILVGDDPASQIYIRNKIKGCEEVGIESVHFHLTSDISEEALIKRIEELNRDERIDGILVQIPLPGHINEEKIIACIDPEKDVDGFHPYNQGRLLLAKSLKRLISDSVPIPCTPYGCIKLLENYKIDVSRKRAVIIGRSNIVGKPLALLLQLLNATVTVVHSKTPDIGVYTREADIVVCAAGKRNIINGDMVAEGVVLIDVGINRETDGKIYGDADFDSIARKASYITPVPGGVGPMTIAMLLYNTFQLGVRRRGISHKCSLFRNSEATR